METIFVMSVIIIPCLAFIVWSFTTQGKKWRRANNLL